MESAADQGAEARRAMGAIFREAPRLSVVSLSRLWSIRTCSLGQNVQSWRDVLARWSPQCAAVCQSDNGLPIRCWAVEMSRDVRGKVAIPHYIRRVVRVMSRCLPQQHASDSACGPIIMHQRQIRSRCGRTPAYVSLAACRPAALHHGRSEKRGGGPDRRVTLGNTGVLRRSRPGGGRGGTDAPPPRLRTAATHCNRACRAYAP